MKILLIVLCILVFVNLSVKGQGEFINDKQQDIVITDSSWLWSDNLNGPWNNVVTWNWNYFQYYVNNGSTWWDDYFTGNRFGTPIWSNINLPYKKIFLKKEFTTDYLPCGTDSIIFFTDDYCEIYINNIFIGTNNNYIRSLTIPNGVLKTNGKNVITFLAEDKASAAWFSLCRVFRNFGNARKFKVVNQNNCIITYDVSRSCGLTFSENELNKLIDSFNFFNGFRNKTYFGLTLSSCDSNINVDCRSNFKEYRVLFEDASKSQYIRIKINVNCSCSPPTCPPPSKVNPFLYNLAGNWQSNNTYAYNTKRESAIANQTRSGEYYKSYNSIMNYNGNYWDIGNNANWISKENNTIIDFNGQTVESLNPLKIPSSGKFAFNKTLTNHIASNAKLEETFFLSNEDNNMFSDAKNSRTMAASNIFAVNEIELPLKPNVNTMWPIISYHGFQNIDSVVRSKDEFHTGFNSLKVLPKTTSNAYAYTNFLFCDYNTIDSVYKDLVYCNSEPTNATGLDITKVTFGGISNFSGCTSLSGSQGNGNGVGGKYSDFTKTILNNNYNRNQNYNLKVDFNLCGDTMDGFCHAYFDWNQDGDFNDNGEVYVLKGSRNKALSASKDIVIPSFALPGKTRMRISYLVGKNNLGVYNLPNSSDPCNYQMYSSCGEVEDYTINIFDNYEWVKNKPTFSINSNDIRINDKSIKKEFSLQKDKEYLLSYWVKDNATNNEIGYIEIGNSNSSLAPSYPNRPSNIEGWHKIEKIFKVSDNKYKIIFYPTPNITTATYYDDIRILPLDGTMKGYVYDELSQRLVSELDENNYATFYDYDEEGQLIRIRKETERGIMTIKESRRSFKQ